MTAVKTKHRFKKKLWILNFFPGWATFAPCHQHICAGIELGLVNNFTLLTIHAIRTSDYWESFVWRFTVHTDHAKPGQVNIQTSNTHFSEIGRYVLLSWSSIVCVAVKYSNFKQPFIGSVKLYWHEISTISIRSLNGNNCILIQFHII